MSDRSFGEGLKAKPVKLQCSFEITQRSNKGKLCKDVHTKCKNKSHRKYRRLIESIRFAKENPNIVYYTGKNYVYFWKKTDTLIKNDF